jgi:hypothetical protein
VRVRSHYRSGRFVGLVARDRDCDVFGQLIATGGDLTHLFVNAGVMVALAAFWANPRGNVLNDN